MNRSNVQMASVVGGASRGSRRMHRICSGMVAVFAAFVFMLWSQPARAVPIALANAGFDDTTGLASALPGNNNFDFATNPYVGWTEFDIASGLPSANGVVNNVGPINVAPSDIPVEATSGALALYVGDLAVRVDQTSTHVISASDASFTLTLDVGRDPFGDYGGYRISLYADNAGSKTVLKSIQSSIDGNDPAGGAWATQTLTILPADFAAYAGQTIGVSLAKEAAGRDVLFDTVALDVTTIPEPGSLILLGCGGALVFLRTKRGRGVHL